MECTAVVRKYAKLQLFIASLARQINRAVYEHRSQTGIPVFLNYCNSKARPMAHLKPFPDGKYAHISNNTSILFLTAFALLGVPFVGYGWSAFFTGVVILAVLFFVLNMKKGKGKSSVTLIPTRLKNTALLCMLMLLIGFSSYALIVIRSTANPPMDQNSPEDIFTLGN